MEVALPSLRFYADMGVQTATKDMRDDLTCHIRRAQYRRFYNERKLDRAGISAG